MKVTVITDQNGKVVGTARHIATGNPAAGAGGPVAGPGESVHVIDLPNELENMEDLKEFHRHLEKLVR
jgi:hypothetical protein